MIYINNRGFQRQHPFIFVMVLALLFLSMVTPLSTAMTSYEEQRGIEIAESHQILFDCDFDLLDCIHLNNEEYYIIKQKNFFLFANRLDIYRSDGRNVENHNLLKSIFEVYAWKQQAGKLKAMDRSDLKGVLTVSEGIKSVVAPLHRVTGTTISAIDEAKVIKIGEIYVWDAATKIKPELKNFENTVRSFDSEVGEWNSASSNLNANLQDVIEGLESMDRGEEIDWTGFAYSTKGSVGALNELRVKTSQMSHRVSSIHGNLKKVNRGLDLVGGGLLAGAFGEMDSKLGSVHDLIDGYTDRLDRYSREFYEISKDVERINEEMDREQRMSLDWEAALKLIYCLLGFIFIGFVITILTLLTDFKEKLRKGSAVTDSINQGILMFIWSLSVGITLVGLFISHVFTACVSKSLFSEKCVPSPEYLTTKISFVSPDPISVYQIVIFLIYFACLIILFSTINGSLTKVRKIKGTLPTSIGNYVALILIFMMTSAVSEYFVGEALLLLMIVIACIGIMLIASSDYASTGLFITILAIIGLAVPLLGFLVSIIILPQILFLSIIIPIIYYKYGNYMFADKKLLIACSISIPFLYSAYYLYYNIYKTSSEFIFNDPIFTSILLKIIAVIVAIIVISIPCMMVIISYLKGISCGESIMQEMHKQNIE